MSPHQFGDTLAPTDTPHDAGAAGFIVMQLLVVIVGGAIHVAVDRRRNPAEAGARRAVELFLVWLLAVFGVAAVVSGIMHVSGLSDELAVQIGYTQSMFQWEVGWADIGIGVLLVGCIWMRGSWMTAAVVMFAISYMGDGIGHVMQYTEHDNRAPANVWPMWFDFIQPLIALLLLVAYRRLTGTQQGVGPVAGSVG